ncbi:MAG: hypothetical protein V1767_05975 [Chloroflexota bacterium]
MSTKSKQVKIETIEYEYPDLGHVEITLREESAEIYRFFKEGGFTKTGKGDGIEHFEKLDQLGALREVHKTAHHSRWEYMVLQMHLIQELKSASAFGFSTSISLTNHYTVSSLEELLKSWVLLNNYGHLIDTIEAERVWLELIFEQPQLRNAFLSCIPDGPSKEYAKAVLKKEDIYQFHHLIALVLLGRLSKKKGKQKRPFDLWIKMIEALVREDTKEGSKLGRALNVFNALRRVSYVLLDINRSALFLRVDSNNLLRNILKKPDDLLYDPESDVSKTLEDIEHLLFTEVYASRQACAFKYQYIKGQKEEFHKSVSKSGIGPFCGDYRTLAGRLQSAKVGSNFGKYTPDKESKHLCRLNLLPNFVFERTACHFYSEQQKLYTEVKLPVNFLVTPTPYTKGGSIIDVFASKNLDAPELSKLYHTLTKYVVECYEAWISDTGGPLNFVMSKPLQELFSHTLLAFVDGDLRLRFPEGTSPSDSHVDIITGKTNKSKWIRRISQALKAKTLTPSRTWELTALLKILKRQKGELLLLAVSNLHLYTSTGERKVEWDGAFFNIEKDNITLYILEAKSNVVSKRSKECSSALLNSIDKAGIRLRQGQFSIVPCTGYAYTKIALTDIAPPASVIISP